MSLTEELATGSESLEKVKEVLGTSEGLIILVLFLATSMTVPNVPSFLPFFFSEAVFSV